VATKKRSTRTAGVGRGFYEVLVHFWRSKDRSLLSAVCGLGVGFTLVVENFSGQGVVSLHLDFSSALENGCGDVLFCAFEFCGSFTDREVESGRSCCGCKFPCNFLWNWKSVMLDRMVDSGGGCILFSIADLADPFLR
jgi:hypothetical protein